MLRNVPNDPAMVRNGAILLSRVEVEVLNASPAQEALPISLGIFPHDKTAIDFFTTSGKPFTASGFWVPLGKGMNFVLVSPPAGAYYWRSIQAGSVSARYAPMSKDRVMDVVHGAVNYVGDLKITIDWAAKKVTTAITNQPENAMKDFRAERPQLAEIYRFASSVPTAPTE